MSVVTLFRADVANLRRDPMLAAAALAPVLIGLLIGFGFEPLAAAASGAVDLSGRRDLFVAAGMLLTPLLSGFVFGFLLVEEREEQVLAAVAVSRFGTGRFLAYRVAAPAVVGSVTSLALGWTLGPSRGWTLVGASVLAGATAGLVCLTMAAVARDRVQALAVSKLTGFVLVAAIGFVFVEGWWRVPLGLLPPTWVMQMVVDPSWTAMALGTLTHLAAAYPGLLRTYTSR